MSPAQINDLIGDTESKAFRFKLPSFGDLSTEELNSRFDKCVCIDDSVFLLSEVEQIGAEFGAAVIVDARHDWWDPFEARGARQVLVVGSLRVELIRAF